MPNDLRVTICRATPADANGIVFVLRSTGWFAHLDLPKGAEQIREHLEACLRDDSHSVYVARGDTGEILGYASVHWLPYLILEASEGFLSELFIRDDVRGFGIGRRLLATVEEEARARGCGRLQLIAFRNREVYQRGFYTKAGWRERPEGAVFIRRF